ncbi:uncharacterized protein LOC120343006 isoform X1 [Styela clava]
MTEAKTKPTFKPKFSVLTSTQTLPKKEKHQTNDLKKNQVQKDEKIRKNIETKNTDKSNQITQNKLKLTSLSDSQYEDIFASVTARVLAEDFLTLDDRFPGTENVKRNGSEPSKTEEMPDKQCDVRPEETNKLTPAENFTKAMTNKSPSLTKRTNEVTPLTSPLDGNEESVLVKQPVLKKKEKKTKKKCNKTEKRKSLQYSSGTPEDQNVKSGQNEHNDGVTEEGTWVQCGACDKWRFLSECLDPSILPEQWICSFNPDKNLASCSAVEEEWHSSSQDSFIYTQFSPGSIVWAKMAGYPSWPAMVDIDPDFNTFYETFPNGEVSYYHVVFLDDRVSRAWISHRYIEAYRASDTPVKMPARNSKNRDFAKDVEGARQRAENALKMSIADRLMKFAFRNRFSGKSHWNRDRNTMEKKFKRKAKVQEGRRREKVSKLKSTSSATKSIEFTGNIFEEKPAKDDKNIDDSNKEHEESKDDTYVSGSEVDEEYWEKQDDEESVLFGNMVVDAVHNRSDEIPFVGDEVTAKALELNSEIFSMEAAKCPQNSCEVLDLSQNTGEKTSIILPGMKDKLPKEEPLDLSGKRSNREDEYWLAPDKPGQTEELFENMRDVHMEDEALDAGAGLQQWEDFEKMVLME